MFREGAFALPVRSRCSQCTKAKARNLQTLARTIDDRKKAYQSPNNQLAKRERGSLKNSADDVDSRAKLNHANTTKPIPKRDARERAEEATKCVQSNRSALNSGILLLE